MTRYVGVFCANTKCAKFIVLTSYEVADPSRYGTDLDPGSEVPEVRKRLCLHEN